ncbi:MAG: glycosyltransferase [Bacteroidetes bacterium]|nr:glycosyltransferase [Bacteroidota bacterium]
MKIVHLNTNASGGAATACFRLHRALLEAGADSRVLTLKRGYSKEDARISSWESFQPRGFRFRDTWNRVRNKLKTLGKPSFFFSSPFSVFPVEDHPWVKEADIVQLHWVAKFIDYRRFFRTGKQYVWTLHDMQPFSGGYHYTGGFNFEAYQNLIRRNEAMKLEALKGIDLQPVAPSKWLADIAAKSAVFSQFGCAHIPNCIDTRIFRPANILELRRALGWPEHKKVLLFLAENLDEPRKGFALLLEALRHINLSETLLVAVGKSPVGLEGLPYIHIPFTTDEQKLAKIYAAADYYITPSLEDNLPNTVMEALACGTPVIAFHTGGIPEMVQHGFNGFLCEENTSASLRLQIEEALRFEHLALMSQQAEDSVQERYRFPIIAQAYLQLYQKLLK